MGKLQAVYWVLVALSLVIAPALRVALKNLGEKSETPSNKENVGKTPRAPSEFMPWGIRRKSPTGGINVTSKNNSVPLGIERPFPREAP